MCLIQQYNVTCKYQRSNKKHENTVSTTENDLTFSETA